MDKIYFRGSCIVFLLIAFFIISNFALAQFHLNFPSKKLDDKILAKMETTLVNEEIQSKPELFGYMDDINNIEKYVRTPLLSQGISDKEINDVLADYLDSIVTSRVNNENMEVAVQIQIVNLKTKEAAIKLFKLEKQAGKATSGKTEKGLRLDGIDNALFQMSELKKGQNVIKAITVISTMDTFFIKLIFNNPGKAQSEKSISDILVGINKERLNM